MKNWISKKSCHGSAEVVVSLTSYGARVNSVFLTIESIAAGRVRPSRIILWLDEKEAMENLPGSLRRLQSRGLEILPCINFGPHKKYYPYVASSSDTSTTPLATADDDMFYPTDWLESLYSVYLSSDECIVSHRARQMVVSSTAVPRVLDSYSRWKLADTSDPSFGIFSTGTGGVIYPPSVLRELRRRGDQFSPTFWSADDIWLHATALSVGVRTRQVSTSPKHYLMLLRSQRDALFKKNHVGDGNDAMIRLAYSPELTEIISIDISSGTSV
ncbi:hypothetical protein ACX80Q_08430 [Arthrobacter sp. HLT1-20]